MIIKNNKFVLEIKSIKLRDNEFISKIYQGTNLVWRTIYNAIKSCFGSGTWIKDKPWLYNDTWKYK